MQQHPDAFPADVFTWESFLWAVATVRARIHAPLQGQQAALVPFADLVSDKVPASSCCCRPLSLLDTGQPQAFSERSYWHMSHQHNDCLQRSMLNLHLCPL